MRSILFVLLMVTGVAMSSEKAEIITPPTEVKIGEKSQILKETPKCEGGSCWVDHGTNHHIYLDRYNYPVNYTTSVPVTGVIVMCGSTSSTGYTCSRTLESTSQYFSKPCLKAREVVSYDNDWRN